MLRLPPLLGPLIDWLSNRSPVVLVALLVMALLLVGGLAVSLWIQRKDRLFVKEFTAARLAAEEKARLADEAARIASVAARLAETEAARARRQAEVAQSETAAVVEVLEQAEQTKPHRPAAAAPPLPPDALPQYAWLRKHRFQAAHLYQALCAVWGIKPWWATKEGKERRRLLAEREAKEREPKEPGPDEI